MNSLLRLAAMHAEETSRLLASAPEIPLTRLVLALIPVGVVLMILNAWSIGVKTSMKAVVRMFLQLLALGYLLRHVFDADSPVLVVAVLAIMLLVASWISLRIAVSRRRQLVPKVLLAIIVGGGSTLVVITQVVLQLDPWYLPQTMIPLAGMIFSNCMNAISLAIERFHSERDREVDVATARRTAMEASLIPITNSLFAVGLVSIPGMMTGQVLQGADARIAAQYQIMVMCMMFGSAGISTALSLHLVSKDKSPIQATDKETE